MEHSFPLIRRFAQMGMVMGLAIFVPPLPVWAGRRRRNSGMEIRLLVFDLLLLAHKCWWNAGFPTL
jgi:hypothetical protein